MDFLLAPKLDPLNWENIRHSLTILWQGLLAIFVVIAVIIAVVTLVNLCVAKAERLKKRRAEALKEADGKKEGETPRE